LNKRQLKKELLQELNEKKKLKIINPETGHIMFVRSLYEIPNGYIRKGHLFSAKEKQHLSEKALQRGTPVAAFRDKSGKNNPMYDKHYIYIHNETQTRRVPGQEVNLYLKQGWTKGRIYHRKSLRDC
jgi:hypothetical protein